MSGIQDIPGVPQASMNSSKAALAEMPMAGKEKPGIALDFPGVRFADENMTTKPQQETQVVVESLRENTMENVKSAQKEAEEMVEVDWLGVPLAASTLPDYTSMYHHHFSDHTGEACLTHDPQTLQGTEKKADRELHEQFEGIGWVARDTVPVGQEGGYVKMGGQVGQALLHPQGDRWTTPPPVVKRLRRTDPMEYLNLCDPLNKVPVERLVYQWTLGDQAAVDERVTVGRSSRSSGFTSNSSPHLPPPEDRNFYSVYALSYNVKAPRDDVEGLHPSLKPLAASLQYPGYGGTVTMDDTPSAFLRMTPHVLRTDPDLLQRPRSHRLHQMHKHFTTY
ncbi:uncharacterized protein [Panulirus ornatus]|uniref:uncharacterized protein n=1 Tax=Panulirus ornatus TaxID=150431 RepID=UPI003A841948